MKTDEYIKLYQKYLAGQCTDEELQQLFSYEDGFSLQETDEELDDEELKNRIQTRIEQTIYPIKRFKTWYKYTAAAAVAAAVLLLYWFVVTDSKEQQLARIPVAKPKQVPAADSTAVMLTLANGEVISLNDAKNGLISADRTSQINKTADNEIAYKAKDNWDYLSTAINKLYVPKGSQYKLTLADGTKVWLNANSTLYYPSAFRGLERSVELSGEAYFEVARNEKMPFVVKTKETRVQVLGTHFNVSAYADDENESTTLTEGSVKVTQAKNSVMLKPGQQSIATTKQKELNVKTADLQKTLAWKDGYFLFKEDNLQDVMKQIARWYNIDVTYQTTAEGKTFGGIYSKSKGLDELLKGLELTGLVNFKLEGRRVIVMD